MGVQVNLLELVRGEILDRVHWLAVGHEPKELTNSMWQRDGHNPIQHCPLGTNGRCEPHCSNLVIVRVDTRRHLLDVLLWTGLADLAPLSSGIARAQPLIGRCCY